MGVGAVDVHIQLALAEDDQFLLGVRVGQVRSLARVQRADVTLEFVEGLRGIPGDFPTLADVGRLRLATLPGEDSGAEFGRFVRKQRQGQQGAHKQEATKGDFHGVRRYSCHQAGGSKRQPMLGEKASAARALSVIS